MKTKVLILSMVYCVSCIGVDIRDAAIRQPIINILAGGKLMIIDSSGGIQAKGTSALLGLQKGEKQLVSIEYLNQYGVKENPTLTWAVEKPAVASVSNNEITALTEGCTLISGSDGKISISINLTVAENGTAVASVIIESPINSPLAVNQTVQLKATLKNSQNENISSSGKIIEWFSENKDILSVTSEGLVSAKANGAAEIHAKFDNCVKSNSIKFNVGAAAGVRTGTFVSAGGYSAVGTVTMEEMGSKVVVTLSSNFQASVALGTFIYLANSTAGGAVKTAGLELGPWSSGAKTYDVPGVTLSQYKYVVVLCKPAGITFGFAELKP
jgi:hypothetical protein